jgi:hypothetical protein
LGFFFPGVLQSTVVEPQLSICESGLKIRASPGSKKLILEFSRLEKQPNVLRRLSGKKTPQAQFVPKSS